MKKGRLILRALAVVTLTLATQTPAASQQEPSDTEPSCEGSITGYEDFPSHCCYRYSCGGVPRQANGRIYFYGDDGCYWSNHHFTMEGCGSCM
jgi:hypothetical protein